MPNRLRRETGRLRLFPDSAQPIVVLGAYLAALRDGDCATSRTLETANFAASGQDFWGPFQITAYEIDPDMATPRDGEVEFAAQVTTRGGDFTLPDGPHTMFFPLDRQETGAWRVAGGGTGP